MTARSRAHQDPNPIDLAAMLRLIAEAPDQRAFFAALRQALPALLPGARADLLVGEGSGSSWRPLAGERGRDPPAGAARSDAGFKAWIESQRNRSTWDTIVDTGGAFSDWWHGRNLTQPGLPSMECRFAAVPPLHGQLDG